MKTQNITHPGIGWFSAIIPFIHAVIAGLILHLKID